MMRKLIFLCLVTMTVMFTSCKGVDYKKCEKYFDKQMWFVSNIKSPYDLDRFYQENYMYLGNDASDFFKPVKDSYSSLSDRKKQKANAMFAAINNELETKRAKFGCKSELGMALDAFFESTANHYKRLTYKERGTAFTIMHEINSELENNSSDIDSINSSERYKDVVNRKRRAVTTCPYYSVNDTVSSCYDDFCHNTNFGEYRYLLNFYNDANHYGCKTAPDFNKFYDAKLYIDGWKPMEFVDEYGNEDISKYGTSYAYQKDPNGNKGPDLWIYVYCHYVDYKTGWTKGSMYETNLEMAVATSVSKNSSVSISDVILKNNKSGESVSYKPTKLFTNNKNAGYSLVGGIINSQNTAELLSKVTNENYDWTIILKAESGKNIEIQRPENFANIQDATINYIVKHLGETKNMIIRVGDYSIYKN